MAELPIFQNTLKNIISCTGVGLHSGAPVTMTLHPADPNTGIVFVLSHQGKIVEIPANWKHVIPSPLCTTLRHESGANVATIEHLLAAFQGCGIDNVIVALDGTEVPIMDGSAQPFVFLIDCAGVQKQAAPRRYIKVLKPVFIQDGDKSASITPSDSFTVSCDIDFQSHAIGKQTFMLTVTDTSFRQATSRARTFGFSEEVAQLREKGLVKGGSLKNAVVVEGDTILNKEGLRYHDEFVRHKVLDAIGDLSLAGLPLLGHFHGVRSGHYLNYKLLEALFADKTAWREVNASAANTVKSSVREERLLQHVS
jgi:UDP-3-O-[3-hydroxymyristoyl] N-acetylglucosamine deacetylase